MNTQAKWVVLLQYCVDDLNITGPYDSEEAAQAYADSMLADVDEDDHQDYNAHVLQLWPAPVEQLNTV
jgi:hypothetical protein